MPKFQKEFPKNALHFITRKSDEAYKKAHPGKYAILVICGIIALLLPYILLALVTLVWFPAPSGFLFLTMVGAFIIGIGLFNIVAAWINQYLGHWVTIGCIGIGSILVAISLIIIYLPGLYNKFEEQLVTYYFISIILLLVPPLFYVRFRLYVKSYLTRKHVNKKTGKRLMKGKRNFWWYEAIHNEVNLGMLYYLNKIITILYPVNLLLSLCLGWIRVVTPIVSGLYAIISVLTAAMSIFSSVQHNLETYGRPIVILRISKQNGTESLIFDLTAAAFPLTAAYAHLLIMQDVLKI